MGKEIPARMPSGIFDAESWFWVSPEAISHLAELLGGLQQAVVMRSDGWPEWCSSGKH